MVSLWQSSGQRAEWTVLTAMTARALKICSLNHSRGNRAVANNDGMHIFKPFRAHWQLNSCLLAAVTLCLASYGYVSCERRRKVNMGSGEKTTFVHV
jgi:hypothetical protein